LDLIAVEPPHFSRDDACGILGIPLSTLAEWEQKGRPGCRGRDDGRFTLSDLLALAVTREMAQRLGPRLDDFAVGLKQLFPALASRPDVERADNLSAVVGPRFAFLWRIPDDDERSLERDIIVVPLRPLLSELRDQVFP
jgi:hypothetical protein